jgi:peptide/nickel transport system permease protein
MARDALPAGSVISPAGEVWIAPAERPFLLRIPGNLVTFARRKPLGAFGGVLVLILVFMAVFGPMLAPYHYNEYELGKGKFEAPSASHILGTDNVGRDIFSRLLYGARISFTIGISVFAISTLLSTTLTLVSAYYIRTVDLLLQRVVELVGFLPDLILIIALFSIYGASPLTLILTLGVLNGINTSRVLRSIVIGIRALPFIESAKAMGASDKRVILRHILPNVAYLIIVGATTAIAAAVTIESGLAIIGIGLDPSYPTWGNMLNSSRDFLRRGPWMAIGPGLMLFLTIFGFRLLGDALRDVLDPRLRGSR